MKIKKVMLFNNFLTAVTKLTVEKPFLKGLRNIKKEYFNHYTLDTSADRSNLVRKDGMLRSNLIRKFFVLIVIIIVIIN